MFLSWPLPPTDRTDEAVVMTESVKPASLHADHCGNAEGCSSLESEIDLPCLPPPLLFSCSSSLSLSVLLRLQDPSISRAPAPALVLQASLLCCPGVERCGLCDLGHLSACQVPGDRVRVPAFPLTRCGFLNELLLLHGPVSFKAGPLHIGTDDGWAQVILCCGGCPVYCRVFTALLVLPAPYQ